MVKPTSRVNVVALLMTDLFEPFVFWRDQPLESHSQTPRNRPFDLYRILKTTTTLMVTAFVEGEVGANRPRTGRRDLLRWFRERLVEIGQQVRELDIAEIGG
jgi:hypothetical protein